MLPVSKIKFLGSSPDQFARNREHHRWGGNRVALCPLGGQGRSALLIITSSKLPKVTLVSGKVHCSTSSTPWSAWPHSIKNAETIHCEHCFQDLWDECREWFKPRISRSELWIARLL